MPNITLGWEIASTTESLVMTAVMLWKAITKRTDSELKRKIALAFIKPEVTCHIWQAQSFKLPVGWGEQSVCENGTNDKASK
jgi:hypothetical protein